MIAAEFQPNLFHQGQRVITDDPYILLEMFVKDHLNTYRFLCPNWERSHEDIYTWKRNGANIIGLTSGRSLSSAHIVTDRTIYESGTYWVLLRTLKQPWQGDKSVSLSIDGTQVGSANTNHQTEHYRYLDFGHIELNSGTHEFRVDFNGKDAWVDHLILYKLDYYSSEETKSKLRLDWSDIEFTQNTMGDINMADVTMPLRSEWNDPNRNIHSRMVFDRTDIVNIILGDDPNNMSVRFGGYLLDWGISDDRSQITFNYADTLINLYRRPNYANYAIGISPSSDNTYTFPVIQMGSAFEALRHMSDTQEYGIMSYGILYPYTFYKNFKKPADFNSATTSGFIKTLDPSAGMRLTYDKVAVNSCGVVISDEAYAVLFNSPSNPFDAARDNIFYMKYLASGSSCNKDVRVQFNIEITMYRAGESPSESQVYNILFSGKAGESNVIGQETPILNGADQVIKFDLKKAFDDHVNSSNYYVTKVRLKDTITASQVDARKNSAITIIASGAYPDYLNKKFEVNQETSYPYENMVVILNELGYVAYVDYARRRGLDVLCVAPEMNEEAPIQVTTGYNAILTDDVYQTKDELRNAKLAHYNYKNGDVEETGISYAVNDESVLMYGPGPWEQYEKLDANNQTDADLKTRKYVEENSYQMQSFTLKIFGVPLLNPSQYVVSSLMNEYLSGNYSTKTVAYTLNRDSDPKAVCRISVNKPGSYYTDLMDRLDKTLEKTLGIENRRQYDSRSLSNMDFLAPGAFVRGGYNG